MIKRKLQWLAVIALGIGGVPSIPGQEAPASKGLPAVFVRTDEWYAFATNPRMKTDFHILITADEKSYVPGQIDCDRGAFGPRVRLG